MKVFKTKVSKFTEIIDVRNKKGIKKVIGLNINNDFIKTRANLNNVDIKKYKVIEKYQFAFNPMQVGRDRVLRASLYLEDDPAVISPAYSVFKITDKNILPNFLNIWLHVPKQQRYFWFQSDSSVRASFEWDNFTKLNFFYPSIEEQKEFCNLNDKTKSISNLLSETNKQIKIFLNSKLEIDISNSDWINIGNVIEEVDIRNKGMTLNKVLGINLSKNFIDTTANLYDVDLSKYKVLSLDNFACNIMHVGRDKALPISLFKKKTNQLISPAYKVFRVKNDKLKEILPEYLMLYFSKSTFDRYAWFLSDSSVRGGLDWKRFCSLKIKKINIDAQRKMINLLDIYEKNKQLIDKVKMSIFDINKSFIGTLDENQKI
jgi:type I restriction enzyme S subunit